MKRFLVLLLTGLLPIVVQAQTNLIVQIDANGEIITEGEGGGLLAGVDTADYAFAQSYGWAGELELDAQTGLATSRENYGPLRIVKPLARSSVLLRKALDQNQRVDVTLRLFAPNPDDGTTEEVYRIDQAEGRVAGIRPFSDGATGQYLEEVRFVWQTIEFTDVQTATSHLVQFPGQP